MPESSDKDARFGRFPDSTLKPGYKQHTVADGKNRVIVGLSVTPANSSEHNSAVEVIDKAIKSLHTSPEVVCADAAYGSGENCRKMLDRGVRLVSPPPKVRTDTRFTTEDFIYNEKKDIFICPAESTLKQIGGVHGRPKLRVYAGLRSVCRICKLKDSCTKSDRRTLKVSSNHSSLIHLRADSKTDSFKKLYKSRAPVIEGIFGEAKEWHGLRRAWRRGLSKMLIQSLLIASVINFKRLGTVLLYYLLNIKLSDDLLERIWSILRHDFQRDLLVSINQR